MARNWIWAVVLGTAFFVTATAADAKCRESRVDVRGDWGQAEFRIDLADDDDERAQGLMFVEEMARDKGMLFIYEQPQHATFWMRNTLIPLDMIFIGEDGVVRQIHENAIPMDETVIDGGDGVLAVLEVNAGVVADFGIAPGDVLRHPAFGEDAVWACPAE